jgi:hypothetical protein
VHIAKVERNKLHFRAAPSISVGYRMSTKKYFVYDALGKLFHQSADVVISEGKLYAAQKAADDTILTQHFYRDVIKVPEPTQQQPTRNESSEHQTEDQLDEDSPPDALKPKKRSQKLAGLKSSIGHA